MPSQNRFELAFRSTQEINESTDGDAAHLLQSIVQHAARVADADIVVLYELNDTERLVPGAAHGVDPVFLRDTMPRSNGVGSTVLKSMRIKIVPDVTKSSSHAHPVLRSYGVETMVVLPVSYGGVPRGLLYVDYRNRRDVDPELAQLLQLFAGSAAQAIERQKLQRVVRDLHAVGTSLTPNSDLDATLERIGKAAVSELSADIFTLYVVRPDGTIENPPRVVALKDGVNLRVPRKMMTQVRPGDVPRRLLETGKSRYWPDASKVVKFRKSKSRARSFVEREQIKSSCGIVLKLDGEAQGVAFYSYRRRVAFSEDMREAIELLSGYAAFALANSRLIHMVRDLAPDDPRRNVIHRLSTKVLTRLERVKSDLTPRLNTASFPKSIRSLSLASDEVLSIITELRQLFPASTQLAPDIERQLRQVSRLMSRPVPQLELELTDEQLSPREIAQVREAISNELIAVLPKISTKSITVSVSARPAALEVSVEADGGYKKERLVCREVSEKKKNAPIAPSIHVLIADCEPTTRAAIAEALIGIETYNFTTATVNSGRAALAEVEKRSYDLVLTDIDLGDDIDGLDVVRKLKERQDPIPKVIFVTRFPGQVRPSNSKQPVGAQWVSAARSLGVEGYFLKQDGLDRLPEPIERVLSGETWFSPSLPPVTGSVTLSEDDLGILQGLVDGGTEGSLISDKKKTRAWMNRRIEALKNKLDADTIQQLTARGRRQRDRKTL